MCFFLGYKNRDTLKTYKNKTYYSINNEDELIQMNVVAGSEDNTDEEVGTPGQVNSYEDNSDEEVGTPGSDNSEKGSKQEQFVDNLI
jgi:hypothetical protein